MTNNNQEIAEMIERIRLGNEDLYTQLVEQYNKALLQNIRGKSAGVLNQEDITDLCWDTWLLVYERVKAVMKSIEPMDFRMTLEIAQIMIADKPSLKFYGKLSGKQVQETCFQDYFELSKNENGVKTPSQISNTISNWILKLENNVRKVLSLTNVPDFDSKWDVDHNQQSCRECKFNKIAPCKKQLTKS